MVSCPVVDCYSPCLGEHVSRSKRLLFSCCATMYSQGGKSSGSVAMSLVCPVLSGSSLVGMIEVVESAKCSTKGPVDVSAEFLVVLGMASVLSIVVAGPVKASTPHSASLDGIQWEGGGHQWEAVTV